MVDPRAYDVAYGVTGALMWLLCLLRLVRLLRFPGDVSARIVCATFASTAAAFTLATPTVYRAVDSATGIPDLATLGVYGCILLTSVGFLALLSVWSGGRAVWTARWAVTYTAVILVMVALFVLGRPAGGEHPVDFDAHYAAAGTLSAFLLLYYAGFAVALGATARLSLRYARMAARPWLGRGLRWIAVGAGFALGYCLLKVIAVVGIMAGARTQDLSTVWAPLSATVGALLMAAGLTVPARAPAVSQAVGRVLAHARLYPLWRALTRAQPSVVLEPRAARRFAPWIERWSVRDVKHRLYRRAVEIHDARLALAPWFDPDAAGVAGVAGATGDGRATGATGGNGATGADKGAEGTDGRRRAAAREAALLAHAVRLRERGAAPPPRGRPEPAHQGGEWDEQLAWLLLVAEEFRRLAGRGTPSRATGGAGLVPAADQPAD